MLSVILPTYNERDSLAPIVTEIANVLGAVKHEIIVVDDDSPDKTWENAEKLRKTYTQLRVLRRTNERGLSSAVLAGFAIAKGTVLAVIDSDGQHDPAVLPELYAAASKGAHVAIASRYTTGGSTNDWQNNRRLLSRAGTLLASLLCPSALTDPLSGCFAVQKKIYSAVAPRLRPMGFKILLEILAHLPHKTPVTEAPLQFRARAKGASKLTLSVQLQFLSQVIRLLFVRFSMVFSMLFFALVVVLLVFTFSGNVRKFFLLYTNPSLRMQVEQTLHATSEREGWLRSTMLLREVHEDHIVIDYRPFHRGAEPVQCMRLYFDLSPIALCDAS